MKFKLLRGLHREDGVTYAAKPNGRPRPGQENMTDVIESEDDLVAKYGGQKYQRLDKFEGGLPPRSTAPQVTPISERPSREELNAMTVADLREYADAEGIDISESHRKEEIINTILSHQGTV